MKDLALLNIFKSFSQKEIDNNQKLVDKILALDEDMQKLTDKRGRGGVQYVPGTGRTDGG